ncbi:hypothetical protein HYS82_00395 [Candidatus Amesbacteria bacterium]|nr:hypothetical protein [Candidatus Amesbacteria bacterium]
MNLVRRSVAFPEDIYEALRLEAFSRRMSVNGLVLEKVRPKMKNVAANKKKVEAKIAADLAYFKKIGDKIKREMGEVDVAKMIREERDRDNA